MLFEGFVATGANVQAFQVGGCLVFSGRRPSLGPSNCCHSLMGQGVYAAHMDLHHYQHDSLTHLKLYRPAAARVFVTLHRIGGTYQMADSILGKEVEPVLVVHHVQLYPVLDFCFDRPGSGKHAIEAIELPSCPSWYHLDRHPRRRRAWSPGWQGCKC